VKSKSLQHKRSGQRRVPYTAILTFQIKYDFHQLSEKHATDIRNTLLELLSMYNTGPSCVMIQICIALATLALQLKSWTTVVPDVVSSCGTSSGSLATILQFLTVLPEEAHDTRGMILTVF
jgi:transportin-3